MILSFLHIAAEMSFPHEILQECKKHIYVHHQKNSKFVLKYFTFFLFGQKHMSSGVKVDFRKNTFYITQLRIGFKILGSVTEFIVI